MSVDVNNEDPERPYNIGFHNLGVGLRGNNIPIELKHGNSGYIWIDSGLSLVHSTNVNHQFTVFGNDKSVAVSVTLLPVREEL